jgi:hypothetical protein
VGSLAYHGLQPGWADVVHDSSVVALALLIAGRTIGLLVGPGTRKLIMAAWRSAVPWIALAAGAYVAGRSGSPLCHPATIWQPHAAWHVFSAVSIGAVLWRSAGRSGGCGVTTSTEAVTPGKVPQPRR